jgi:predicted O-methyltransferase YrrM
MESIDDYITEHIDQEPDLLKHIYREAQLKLLHGNMSSGHLQGRLLKMLVHMVSPNKVLEIGTFTGYSALCMAEALDDEATLHTIEIDDEVEDLILSNFSQSLFGEKIVLHIGDANEVVQQFENNFFDLVYIDGNKRDYWLNFESVLPKTKKGGFIIADNTLWHGKVVEQVKSNDWQTKGILEFNNKLKCDDRVEKVILPLRDGLTLIRKI